MGGGLMQLVAYGAQDVYLTGNPQITFWKVTYRRHTNFAMESIEQTFNGQADFGRRVTCTVSRNGDLAYRTYLQVTLPEINQGMNPKFGQNSINGKSVDPPWDQGVYARWLDFPGEQLISQVEVEIGGQRIDRQYGDWMHIWNQLTLSAEQERGYYKMVGNTTQLTYVTDPLFSAVDGPCTADAPRQVCAPRNALPETTLYVPFQFWYCRNPGLALPLIALQYHEVRINLDLRPIDECLWAMDRLKNDLRYDGHGNTSHAKDTEWVSAQPYRNLGEGCGKKVPTAYAQSIVAASLYVDYVFLDTDERRRMAQNPHEYLIEQLQFTGDESVGSSSNKIKLNFNHPCKELIWVVQPDENVDYCASFDCNQHLFNVFGAQPFNYTDAIDALPNAFHAFGTEESLTGGHMDGEGFITNGGLFQQVGPGGPAGQDEIVVVGGAAEQVYSNTGINVPSFERDGSRGSRGNYPVPDGEEPGGSAPGELNLGGQSDRPNVNQGWDDRYTAGDINGYQGTGHHYPAVLAGVSDAGTFVLSETALTMHCWGENPVVTAKLQLNGQDRFSEREGTYFDLVQPYQHHTRNPDTGINVYSFALRPEEHQPSGTCNFSRIDNATLQLILSNATVEGTKTAKVRVYATNYNVLRIMSGMGKFNLIYFLLAFWVHLGYVCAIKTALKSNLPPTNRFCRGAKQLVSYPVHYGRQTITSPLIPCY
jgi:hypothetical protein